MRLFFAVAFDDDVREKLTALAEELRQAVPEAPVSWVAPGNMHLTLRFLGEVEDARIPGLLEMGRSLGESATPFELHLEGVDTFGGKIPRVVWVGIREDEGKHVLADLAAGLEKRLRPMGFPAADHAFAAHATLGRVRDPGRAPRGKRGAPDVWKALAEALAKRKDLLLGRMRVTSFVLYQSILRGAQSPEYRPAGVFELGSGPPRDPGG